MSDIGARAGLTRAAISLYAKGERGENFPSPVARVTTDSPLWLWSEVAAWLARSGKLPQSAVQEAQVIEAANANLGGDPEWMPQPWVQARSTELVGFAEAGQQQPFEAETQPKR